MPYPVIFDIIPIDKCTSDMSENIAEGSLISLLYQQMNMVSHQTIRI